LGCTAKTEQEAFTCLEKNEKHGVENEGFSAPCAKAHMAYESSMHKKGKEKK
jgi:hypothetical protein